MLFVFCSWIVIGVSAFLWGDVALAGLLGSKERNERAFTLKLLFGLCLLTVYAEFFSLFYRVGTAALSMVLILDVVIAIVGRKRLAQEFRRIPVWMLPVVFMALVLVLPLAASYIYNYDTLLYHAQAIRWIEEYGVVRGIGNLHSRLAFNNAFFCLQALFSFREIVGQSMHSVNGFVAWVMLSYSICSLKIWRERRFFTSDFLRLAILFFLSDSAYEFSSPGTDFFAHLLTLFLIAETVSLWEDGCEDAGRYAVLSILSVYAFTLKLSSAPVVLITLIPAVILIQNRQWKKILLYLGAGILIMIPFCARNIVISGYLIYPLEKLDLFRVEWKLPAWVCRYERLRTKAWAEGIFGVLELDSPFSAWLPYWKAQQTSGTLTLLLADGFSCIGLLFCGIVLEIRKKDWKFLIISITITVSLVYWFLSAPHVRFGRPYLLMPVFLLSGFLLAKLRKKEFAGISVAVLALLTLYPLFHLFTAARAEERHFIRWIDYGESETIEYNVDGITVFLPAEGDQVGYHALPAAIDLETVERLSLLGNTVRDGFKTKQ